MTAIHRSPMSHRGALQSSPIDAIIPYLYSSSLWECTR